MADSTTQNLHISLPGAGKTQTYQLTADTPVQFDFDLAEAVFTGNNGNLQIAIEGGGTIILEDYQALAEAGALPTFQMMDGEQVPGDVYLFAFADAEQTADEVETAADGAAGGSGAGEYNDDPGSLGDGIDALGGQDDAYDGHSLLTLSGILGNVAPTANDDFAEITEQGDPDFIIGRHIVFVDPDQTPDGDTPDGDAPMGEFFPLADGGGFYIRYPNPPQTDEVIEGNVIDNDSDPDGDDSLLRMFTIDHIGPDHTGADAPGVEVASNDTVIMGKYGVLVIDADGSWDYTLNQEWADELNEGETYDEVFAYTITDGLGAASNTATLTITVNGANDMPVAHDDLNVQAVEVGDSTDYGLAANVTDAELGDVTVYDETDHDFTGSEHTTVHGNVLSGDDFGGATDSDVDSNDSPDGQSLFVVGVYSAATQTVDYELPTEGNADFIPSDDQAYDIATMDPDATVTVNGQYGVLTIEADGDYTYTLYTTDDGEAYDALNALNYDNPGTDSFSYGIMDDSGAFSYANLTFTVNGANDAPIAYADTNSVVEFGIKFGDVDDYSATVSGNVIAGDANGGVADTDADNADMFVATVSSQTDESGSLYTSAGDPANQESVTINGEYGTLTIHADGSYEYTLQNEWDNVQALNEGDNPTDVFTYTLTNSYADGVYSEPVTLTINVIGSNDNPVAVADTNAFTESVDDESAAFVEGNVLAGDDNGGMADTDVDNELADFTVTGIEQNGTEATPDTEGYDFVLQGQYGTLYMNENGTYKYVEDPDATDHLNIDDEPVTDVFTYTMSDNEATHTGFSSSTLTITISGANDAPVAENDFGVAKEAGFFTDGSDASGNVIDGINLPILGNIGGDSDVDSDTLTVTHVVSDDNPGSQDDVSETGETSIAGKFGTLYIESDGSYRYELDDDADHVNELNVWDVEDESFTYTVTDEHGASSTATLTIAINGSNDAPAALDDANTSDAVTEQGVNEPGDAVAMGNVLGNDTDIDHNDNSLFVKSIAAGAEGETTSGDASVGFFGRTIQGQYGSLHINRDGSYTYTLNNDDPDTQALTQGEIVHDEFTYTVSDPGFFGSGKATDTATLSIEITGTNDAAIITGDDSGAVTEDVDVTAAGLLTDSGQIFASDVDNPDNLFQEVTTTDDQGGTFHMGTDGQWTYEISNDSVQHLGEVDGVNNGFTNDFTVKSVDGTEHTVTVTVSGDNDAPLGADFTVQGNNFGEPIGIDFDVAPITDVEDDYSTIDTLNTGVIIDSLPEHGTLYYNGEEVEASDLGSTRYDDLDNFTYVGDAPENQGVLLGSRTAEDAGLDTWGEADGSATRVLGFDSDGDGTDDVTITTTINSGSLMVFGDQQDHIDHGLANASNNGLDSGETLTIDFDGKDVSYAEIGFGGLGSYFNEGAKQDGEATWAVYNDGELIASGTVNNSVMTWANAITGESGTITGGDGDTFQSLVLDQTILGGESFDQAVFGTTEADSKDWNANWELQYVDVEFAQTDSFTYRPIDSEGLVNEGDPYVVTVDVLPGAYNEDPTAVDDVNSVYEPNIDSLDSSVSANVLVNEIDPDNTPSEMSVTSVIYDGVEYDLTSTGQATFNTTYGTMEFHSDGSYTYTATDETLPQGAQPTETFTYTMTDGDTVDNDPVAQSANLVITVNGLNDAPVALNDLFENVNEGSGSAVSLGFVAADNGSGADYDIDLGDAIDSFSAVGDLPAGVTLTPEGEVLFNANDPAYNGLAEGHTMEVTFQYVANDGDLDSDPATVTFTVVGTNDGATIDLGEGDKDTGSVMEIVWSNDDPALTDDFQASLEDTPEYDQFGNLIVEAAPGTLHTEGHVTVTDPDDHSIGTPVDSVDEATLAPTVTHNGTEYTGSFDASGDYSITTDEGGTFTIKADGSWSYDIDNTLDVVQQLADGQSFEETFTVESYDGTANHDITVTVDGTNDAPVITAVGMHAENFEQGAEGWTNNTVTETDDVLTDYLGNFAGSTTATKVFDVAEGTDNLTIEFDMYEIDSWDGETFTITVNGETAEFTLHHNQADGTILSWRGADGEITDGTFSGSNGMTFTVTPITGDAENLESGDTWIYGTDQIHHVTISIPNPESQISLGFSTDLNSGIADESWGIDNLIINAVDDSGNPIFTVLENVSGPTQVAQFSATDTEDQDVSYTIDKVVDAEGNDVTGDGLFVVDGDRILTADGVAFDYETNNQYTITVSPVDSQGAIGQDVELTVNIGNVNEAPVAHADTAHVTEPDGLISDPEAEIATGNILTDDTDPDITGNTPDGDTLSLTEVTFTSTGGVVTTVDFENNTITIDGSTTTYAGSFETDYGTLEISANGDYTFTATNEALVEGYSPTESIAYTTTDTGGLTSSSTLTITVDGLNDAPVAVDDILTNTTEDSGVVSIGTVATGDSDIDTIDTPDTLTYSLVTDDPAHPTPLGVSVAADGSVTVNTDLYQYLGEGETETVTFTYQVSDNHGGTDTATAQFTITGDNDNPTLDLSGGYLTYEGKSAGYNNILCSYEMVDGQPVNPQIIAVFEGGDAVDEQIGDIIATYPDGEAPHYFLVPNVGSSVTDASEIELVWVPGDADAGTSGEWNVTVDGSLKDARFDDMSLNPNDSEASFGGDPYHDFEVEADDQLVDGYKTPGDDDDFNDILAQEHDGAPGPDNGPVIFTEGDGPVHVTGAVDISDIDSDNMSMVTITYTPQEGDVLNIDTTGFISSGPVTDPDTGIVTWTISGDAPKADYEALLQTMTFQNDLDNLAGDDPTTDTIENLRTFTIQVFDDEGAESNTAVASVQVNPVNDAPDAIDDGSATAPIEVGEDAQNFAINVLGNDTDPDLPNDTLEVVSVGTAAHGTVTIGANGQVLYTPDANYNGEDSFTYTIEDEAGASDTATVYVNVTPVNDAPVAVDDTGHADGTGVPVGGDVPTSDYHLVAEASYDDGQTFTTNGASVSSWGQNIGVLSGDDGNGNDKNIENNGSIERLLIVFDDPQTSVDLKLTADGNLEETVLAWDENGNPITDLSVTEANDIITVTSPTTTIGTVVLMADDGESVALKEVVSSSPAPTGDVDNVIPVIEGNVLANDYDAEDTDYPETDDPTTSTLEGSTELTVTGIAAGDLDDQLGAELTQDNDEGSIMDGFDGHIGNTFTPAGESVQGQFGVLEIGANGEYTYTPNDGIAPGDYAETFTYQVSDTDGAVDYGTIDVSVTVPVLNTDPTAIDDLFDTTTGYNVVTEDGGTAVVGSAPNYLVVLDTSGSMDDPNVPGGTETRLDVAKAALVEMMETLQAQVNETGVSVTVGIVDFDYHHDGTYAYTNTFTLTRNTDLNDLSNDAIDYINTPSNLIASGGTDYNDAFSAANAWVADEGANGNSNEVIFISDGDPHYYYNHWFFGVQQGDFAPGEDNYGAELTALQDNANVTAVGIAMSGSAEDRMDAIDESSDGAIFLTSATGLNDVLTDIVAGTMPTPMTTATGNVIDGHDDILGQSVGEDIDDDGDTMSVISVGRGQQGSETDVILLTDTVNDDADTATMVGQFGTLTINADGSYEYTPDQPASDALPEGQTGQDFFTYTISDGNGGTDSATVSFLIYGANDAPVAVDDLGHGVFVTDTLQTVDTYGWSTETASHINFNDTSGNDKWTKVDDRLGLRVSASTEDGHNASVEQTGNGIGVNTKNTFDSDQIASTNSHGKETLTLDFGNHTNNSDHEMPLGVKIMLGDVSGFGEQVILTVTDSEGNTTTVTGTNGMSLVSNGITISNYGAANEWFVTGTQGDADGNGQVLIDTIAITAGNNASFSLYAMEVTNASDWVLTGSTTTGVQTAAQVSGYVLGNDFDAENDAMTAAIVGSGVGLWGTLTMADNGAWTYDPNETAIFDDSNGLTGPAVEQFTYQVTDAHGLTDTATLYVPLHYNTAATADGTSGDDVVYGTSGDDIISGLEGNDFLYGEAGNDHIDGGLGHDYISGGDGNDVLNGGDGNDMLFGGNGNDTIWGGAGDDIISAGSGDDSVYISSGHDTVTLGAGADTIHIDPSYLTSGDGGGHMTVTDFNTHGGDLLDLSSLTTVDGATAAITSSIGSEDLVLTINNVNGDGDGITITLEGVMSATHATDISQTVDISHDDVNTLIQHIIDSPDSY